MARYGRAFGGRMRRSGYGGGYGRRRRRLRGPGPRELGYGAGYRERPHPSPGYARWRGYAEEYPIDYDEDIEYGGRAWPYDRGGPEHRRGWRAGPGPYESESWRPGGYGYGRRRLRSRRPVGPPPPRRRYARGYGAEFEGQPGYGGYEFARGPGGSAARTGRYAGRSYARREEPRYGYTPSSRWPEDGHDVDHRDERERTMADGDIRDAVVENLFQDSFVDPRDIDVEVEDGVVRLAGDVGDFMEARYVWDDAWESAGVRGVIDNLTVRTDRPSDDMEMPQTSGGTRGGRPTPRA